MSFSRGDKWCCAAAFAFAAAILFFHLGNSGMYAAQEGRTGLIVRQMLVSGDYLNMNLPECIPYEKPIGHYWLSLPTAALCGVGGDPLTAKSEWGLRLPSALAGMALLFFTALLAARIYDRRTAALAVTVLGSSLLFVHLGRLAHVDMMLACACGGAMYFLYRGFFENMRANRFLYGFYAMLGFGVLVKGPLPVILAGLTVLAMTVLLRRWKLIWELRPLTGALVFLAVALPWYAVEIVRSEGEFFWEFIWRQNLQRFTGVGSTYRNGEFMPLYYYFAKLPAGFAPWSLVALAGVLCFGKRLVRLNFSTGTRFLLMWFLTGFVFFTLSALKRGDYLLPLYPALAMLTGAVLKRGLCAMPALRLKWWLPVWSVLLLAAAGFLTLSFSGVIIRAMTWALTSEVRHISRGDARNTLMLSEFINSHAGLCVAVAVVLLGVLFGLGALLQRRKTYAAFAVFCAGVLSFFWCFYGVIEVRSDRMKSTKEFVAAAREHLPAGAPVALLGDFNVETVFFLDRRYTRRLTPEIRFAIVSPEDAPKLLNQQWKLQLATPEGHFYPQALYVRLP